MLKIDLITMHAVYNYGSALQTYATQKILSDLGYFVEIIDYYPNRMRNYGSLQSLYTAVRPFYSSRLVSFFVALLKYPAMKFQRKSFISFSKKYFNLSKKYNSNLELVNDPPIADIYCSGSDQIWNNFFENGVFDLSYFLNFGLSSIKRISYASSFGRSDITGDNLAQVEKLLEKYYAISVREESGLDIIKNINVKEKKCVLDPTLLINRKAWLDIASPISEHNYILVYQLHEETHTSQIATEIGKIFGKKVIRVTNEYFKRIRNGKTIVSPKVEEFISYIANADLVITDSFHGTAFSINFNVPFVSVKWKMFNDRIGTLLCKTGLDCRFVGSIEEALNIYNKPINYERVNETIDSLRKYSYNYLSYALDIKEL